MKCSFCGEAFPPSQGTMYVLRTGKKYYFCSRKCEVHLLRLKRSPRTTRWTRAAAKLKQGSPR